MKFQYATQAEIPAALQAFYKEEGGVWVLQCDGAVSKTKVDEFRDKNVQLQRDMEALTTKFKDVDPAKYLELKGKEDELNEGKLIKKEGLEAAVTARVEKMRTEYDTKLKELQGKLDVSMTDLSGLKIDQAVLAEAGGMGLRKTAHADAVARAKGTFKLVDGVVVALDEKGQKMFGADGNPLTIKEWSGTLLKGAPHLFEENKGGGAAGGGGGGGHVGPNPWAKESVNITAQMTLARANPAEATRMAAAAGVKLDLPAA